jgi:integrase
MFTEPEIVSSSDLKIRAYVKVYIDGQRHRFYNGKQLEITCNPNHARTTKDRDKALTTLSFNLRKKLETGWRPVKEVYAAQQTKKQKTAVEAVQNVITDLLQQDLSALYKRDISSVGTAFLNHLKTKKLSSAPVETIDGEVIESFLKQFTHSATYYMNKRRTLGAIFSRLVKGRVISKSPLVDTARLKERSTLHQAYTKEQMRQVLLVLESRHPNLFICALLMYGCFLRPHQEIRKLFRHHLNTDCTTITLGGESNKSGRVRTVFVPQFVRDALTQLGLFQVEGNVNLFTRCCDIFNESYFNTSWSRIKEDLVQDKLVGKDHTLYSFRHTAAVNLYMKTKDPYKVQQAMGHSSLTVTLTYMRNLGLVNNLSSDDALEL